MMRVLIIVRDVSCFALGAVVGAFAVRGAVVNG